MPALPCRPLSMRFRNPAMEAGFLESRKVLLLKRLRWLCYIHLLGSMSVVLVYFVRRRFRREDAVSDMAFESLTVQASVEMCLTCLLLLALSLLRFFEGRPALQRRALLLEACPILFLTLSMTLVVFTFPTKFAKLRGFSLVEAFADPYGSDSSMVLTIDIFITAAHLGLPVRWFIMAPMEVAALLLYVTVIALVGSEEAVANVFFNFVLLLCLVLASSVGKRAAEQDERRSFLENVKEKSLRFEAEFQLSQAGGKPPQRRELGAESQLSSEPVTDRSGAIFEPIYEGGDKVRQLQLVAAKGDSEHWRIPATDIQLLDEGALGTGGFGQVQRAVFCGIVVAVKYPRLDLGSVTGPDLCNELRVLRHLRHPNIVASHGAIVLPQEQQLFLVLELIEGRDLAAFLVPEEQQERPTLLQRYQVMLGVCRALLYMHTRSPHIVHGDLTGSNIMVEMVQGRGAFPKLLDFGLSRVLSAQTRPLGGTMAWLAPEVLNGAPVRCSADVYSFGRVVAFAATSIPPMWNMSQLEIMRELQQKKPPLPPWPAGCAFSGCCKPLVEACLEAQQERRPRIQQLHRELLALASSLDLPEGAFLRQVRAVAHLSSGPAAEWPGPAGEAAPVSKDGSAETRTPPTGALTDSVSDATPKGLSADEKLSAGERLPAEGTWPRALASL